MDVSEGQVNHDAATIYEEFFVPALFAQWAPRMADAAGVSGGQRALDVACGTGVLTRELARRVGPDGACGLDRNPGMLAAARRAAPAIAWHEGRAEALPFEDATFDSVLSQFGLMFFEDRAAALSEMRRVLRPGGRLAVAVWSSLEQTPGYAAMVGLLQRLFGAAVADELRAPFVLGEPDRLAQVFSEAGISPRIERVEGRARFPSLEGWLHTDVRGWTLADRIDDGQFARLREAAEAELRGFVQPDGTVEFAAPALIATDTPAPRSQTATAGAR